MSKLQKTIYYGAIGLLTMFIVGCGATQPSIPKTTEQLQVGKIDFNFKEYHEAEIQYHTKEELEKLFKTDLLNKLNEKGLIDNDTNESDIVNITANYTRRFVGDATPFPADSLGYPDYDYTIEVLRGSKSLGKIHQDKLVFKGGVVMNAQVVVGALRDKKYEVDFIEAYTNKLVDEISDLEKE